MLQVLLILHFLGLALGVGTGFAMMTLGKATADMPAEERSKFMLRAMVLGRNGSIGFLLLVLSGLGMMALIGFGRVFAAGGAFHAKLTLVLVMAGVLGYMQTVVKKVKQAGGGPLMAKLPKLGAALLLLGICVVILAVTAFE